jgi:hypothetical protein
MPTTLPDVALTGPLAEVLDAVAARRTADTRQLTALSRELRRALPRRQVTVTRRGFPIVNSKVVGLRVLAGDQVFRLDTTTGTPVAEVGSAINGVVSSHTAVPVDEWATALRAALERAAATGLGPALGPLQ